MESDKIVYTIKRNLHGSLKICILFSRVKNNVLLVRKILFLPLENKIHIFAPPCNILYLCDLSGDGVFHITRFELCKLGPSPFMNFGTANSYWVVLTNVYFGQQKTVPAFFVWCFSLSHFAYVAQFFTFMYIDSSMFFLWLYFQTQIPVNVGYYLLVAFILLFYVTFLLILVSIKFFYLCVQQTAEMPTSTEHFVNSLIIRVDKGIGGLKTFTAILVKVPKYVTENLV